MDYEASNSIASSQDHFDGTHGRIHQSPDTHGSQNSDYFKDLDSKQLPPTPGGGGGGGATAIFRVRKSTYSRNTFWIKNTFGIQTLSVIFEHCGFLRAF